MLQLSPWQIEKQIHMKCDKFFWYVKQPFERHVYSCQYDMRSAVRLNTSLILRTIFYLTKKHHHHHLKRQWINPVLSPQLAVPLPDWPPQKNWDPRAAPGPNAWGHQRDGTDRAGDSMRFVTLPWNKIQPRKTDMAIPAKLTWRSLEHQHFWYEIHLQNGDFSSQSC